MKKIFTAITLASSLLLASPLDLAKQKRAERQHKTKEAFNNKQNLISADLGWLPKRSIESTTRKGTATISGKIGQKGNHKKSFSLYLYDEFGYLIDNTYMSSDSFSFSNLYPGKYTYKIDNYDYKPIWYGNTNDPTEAIFTSVSSGNTAQFDSISINWESTIEDSMYVFGTLTENGTPIANTSLDLYYNLEGNGNTTHFLQTDEEGKFGGFIKGVHGKECFIMVKISSSKEYTYIRQWINGNLITDDCPTTIFTDSLKADIHAVTGGSISGKVEVGFSGDNYLSIAALDSDGYVLSNTSVTYSDSTYTLSGLPSGDYYLRIGSSSEYEDTFYPQTSDFKNAKSVSVEHNKTTQVNVEATPKTGDNKDKKQTAYIKGSVVDKDGNPVIIDYVTVDYGSSTHSFGTSNSSDFSITTFEDSTFKVAVSITDMYLAEAYWENGKDTILSKGDTLEVLITLPDAGSIAGTCPNETTFDMTDSLIEVGIDVVLSKGKDSLRHYSDSDIPGKYRIPSVPSDTYTLTTMPFLMNETGNALSKQPKGSILETALPITVTSKETTVNNITGTEVSGMISGTYTFDGVGAEWIYYAVKPDGTLISAGMAYKESDAIDGTNNKFHGLMPRDWDVWSSIHSKDIPITTIGAIDIPLLAKGDYYIFLAYWDQSLDEEEMLHGIWYGQKETKKISLDDVFLDEHGNLQIPTDAKKLTLATNDTWLKGINFGSTAIIADVQTVKNNTQILTSKATITLHNTPEQSVVTVYSLPGKKLISKELGTIQNNTIQHNLASGTYVLKMKSASQSLVQKIRIP